MRDFLSIVLLLTVSFAKQVLNPIVLGMWIDSLYRPLDSIYLFIPRINGNTAKKLSHDGEEALESCKEQEGASDDDFQTLQRGAIPTTVSGKCFLACMMEKSHLMKDGKYDSKHAVKMTQGTLTSRPRLLKKAKNQITTCSDKSQEISDRCEYAASFAQCMQPKKSPPG